MTLEHSWPEALRVIAEMVEELHQYKTEVVRLRTDRDHLFQHLEMAKARIRELEDLFKHNP